MALSKFFFFLTLICSLGPVVVVPKLYATKHFHLGCVAVWIACILYVVLADPRAVPLEVRILRGISIGATVLVLGLVYIWVRKKYPNAP